MMDSRRRFPAPWVVEEHDGGFRVKDANGFFICGTSHRDDLHRGNYQYATNYLSRDEARRIATAISRLPELLRDRSNRKRVKPMTAFLIVQIKLLASREQLAPYRDAVKPCAEKFGGRYIVGGGVKISSLEGGPHDGRSLVIFEFPSLQTIHAFWNSPEYVDVKRLREGLAEFDAWAVPGIV